MKPVYTGLIAGAAVVVAFVAGSMIEIESDGDISIGVEQEGPIEQLGESIDEATK